MILTKDAVGDIVRTYYTVSRIMWSNGKTFNVFFFVSHRILQIKTVCVSLSIMFVRVLSEFYYLVKENMPEVKK